MHMKGYLSTCKACISQETRDKSQLRWVSPFMCIVTCPLEYSVYGIPKQTVLSNQNFVGKIVLLPVQTTCSCLKFFIHRMFAFANRVFMVKLLLCISKLSLHSQTCYHGQSLWSNSTFAFADSYFHDHEQKAHSHTGKFFHAHKCMLAQACLINCIKHLKMTWSIH